jgi:hypothetical protein
VAAKIAASAPDYVLGLALPDSGPTFEAAAPFPFTDQREAVVVGAQMAEFTDSVPATVRAAISDSILLAQLAANHAADASQDVLRWYDKYIEVLQNVGWQLRDIDFETQSSTDLNAGVHQAIIPVVTALLAPGAAASSIILAVLKGLQQMDTNSPWMTLFDQKSEHSHGAKFQVSYVDADEHGEPVITLACFGVQADQTVTQVLFFKFMNQNASIKQASGKMAVSMMRLGSAKDAIADRVQPFISDFIKNVEI